MSFSKEHIEKLKLSHKGQVPWNKNKTNVYTKESLQKISENTSEAMKKFCKNHPEFSEKVRDRMLEKWKDPNSIFNSKEFRKSLKQYAIDDWKNPNSKHNSKEWRELQRKNAIEQFKDPIKLKNFIEGNRRKPNKLEEFLTKLINETFPDNFEYVGDYKVWIEEKNPDWISQDKKIIEFFGDYYHCDPEIYKEDYFNKKVGLYARQIWSRDEKKIKKFKENGFEVLVVWEKELKDISSLIQKIKNFGEK